MLLISKIYSLFHMAVPQGENQVMYSKICHNILAD